MENSPKNKGETKAFPNKSWENSCCTTRNGKQSSSDLKKMNTEKNHDRQKAMVISGANIKENIK